MASSSSALSAFSTGIVEYIAKTLAPPIVSLTASKGVTISVEEILQCLEAPSPMKSSGRSSVPPTSASVPLQTPPMAFGGSSDTAQKRARKDPEMAVPGQGCIYEFVRGNNRGKRCDKRRADGSMYCSSCLRKTKVQSEISQGTSSSSSSSSSSTPFPSSSSVSSSTNEDELQVVVYDEARNLFREIINNFIVRDEGDDGIVVIGKLRPDKTIGPLTAQDEKIARNLKLKISSNCTTVESSCGEEDEEVEDDLPTVVQKSPPEVKPSNQTPSVPSIPIVPSMTSVPSIPSIPSIPYIPSIPNIPSIPSIPGATR